MTIRKQYFDIWIHFHTLTLLNLLFGLFYPLHILNFLIELLCPFFFFDFYIFHFDSWWYKACPPSMEQSFEKVFFNCKSNREVSIMVRCCNWGEEIKINSKRLSEFHKVFWKKLRQLMKIDTFFETQKMQHPLKNLKRCHR